MKTIDSQYANLLESTFLHLPGIGIDKEKALWKSGIANIQELKEKYFSRSIGLFEEYRYPTKETEIALENNDISFFLNNLPRRELYRAALTNFSDVIFLDIETTGLSKYYSYITVVGWILNGKYQYLIKGQSPKRFFRDLSRSKIVVTFNGSLFDIPFLYKEFQEAIIPHAHIDLRFFSRRFGYTGGQKEIEETLQIGRPKCIKGINGKDAIVLWYKYLAGDIKSIELLLQYNYYDINGMQQIFDKLIDKHVKYSLPKYNNPIYKFSHGITYNQIKVSKYVYQQTKTAIKNFTITELSNPTSKCTRVVGIDLTGSERKASGCCLLQHNIASTVLLKTDQELIDYVLTSKPDVVSIDSPLSLPIGRNKVTDDDEGRYLFGITRHCERELKKRGVNVYPCLIYSMQKLTARGIKLATKLRALGIPVIESFPGAAQDILRIPRKKTDMYFLKKGLLDFGIVGEVVHKDISHDELDAITSAIVGLFFLKGRYEALGHDEENYLIIPSINNSVPRWGARKIIGFSGPIASGKTTASMLLNEQGYYYTRFSKVLEEMLRQDNIDVNRDTLQEIGNRVNKERGQYWLCKKLVSNIPYNGNIVIDGLRHPEDHAYFVEYFGPDFLHIYVDTDSDFRRERYAIKNGSDNEFIRAIEHPVEKNTHRMKSLAHLVVNNNSLKSHFEDEISNIIKTI